VPGKESPLDASAVRLDASRVRVDVSRRGARPYGERRELRAYFGRSEWTQVMGPKPKCSMAR
jgi:hypothetical protein